MKFVWLTDNYRVNLESIFSLEQKYIDNSESVIAWKNSYNDWQTEIYTYGIHNDNIDLDITDIDNISDDNKLIIDNYIKGMLGECPNIYKTEYYIILSTGVKLQIAQDKFFKINEAIDNT